MNSIYLSANSAFMIFRNLILHFINKVIRFNALRTFSTKVKKINKVYFEYFKKLKKNKKQLH